MNKKILKIILSFYVSLQFVLPAQAGLKDLDQDWNGTVTATSSDGTTQEAQCTLSLVSKFNRFYVFDPMGCFYFDSNVNEYVPVRNDFYNRDGELAFTTSNEADGSIEFKLVDDHEDPNYIFTSKMILLANGNIRYELYRGNPADPAHSIQIKGTLLPSTTAATPIDSNLARVGGAWTGTSTSSWGYPDDMHESTKTCNVTFLVRGSYFYVFDWDYCVNNDTEANNQVRYVITKDGIVNSNSEMRFHYSSRPDGSVVISRDDQQSDTASDLWIALPNGNLQREGHFTYPNLSGYVGKTTGIFTPIH